MRIIGCDLHARQQTVAMLNTATGEVAKMTLQHEGHNVREFYSTLPRPARVGIEATGSMQWFVSLMEELGTECLVGQREYELAHRGVEKVINHIGTIFTIRDSSCAPPYPRRRNDWEKQKNPPFCTGRSLRWSGSPT
jgi:hypothetical protein